MGKCQPAKIARSERRLRAPALETCRWRVVNGITTLPAAGFTYQPAAGKEERGGKGGGETLGAWRASAPCLLRAGGSRIGPAGIAAGAAGTEPGPVHGPCTSSAQHGTKPEAETPPQTGHVLSCVARSHLSHPQHPFGHYPDRFGTGAAVCCRREFVPKC